MRNNLRLLSFSAILAVLAFPQQPPPDRHAAQIGLDAFNQRKFTTAIYFLSQAVSDNPRHTWAWNDLCRCYLALDRWEDAADACRKQIEVYPESATAYNNLGRALQQQQKYEEAIAAFRKQIEISPRDRFAHANLGSLYYRLQRYSDAVPELEMAAEIEPQNSGHQVDLGGAYLGTGQTSKGLALLEKAVQEYPVAPIWNTTAYHLAAHGISLDKAQKYAESAIAAEALVMRNIDLDHIAAVTLRHVTLIGNCWDTLGWIHFQQDRLDDAAKFLNAAWSLNQSAASADHLGRLYAKLGKSQEAIQMFAMSLVARDPLPDTRARLLKLLGADANIDALLTDARSRIAAACTVHVDKQFPEKSMAEIYLALEPPAVASGAGATHARFIKGDERLRPFANDLAAASNSNFFPDSTVPTLVRRATLTCPGAGGNCSLEFAPAPVAAAAELNDAPVDKDFVGGSSQMSYPSVIYKIEPQYTEKARKKKIQGTIVLSAEIDTTGRARNIRVLQGLGMGLDEEAIKAVGQWRFKPAEKDGQPISIDTKIEVNFRLLVNPR